ncbi:PREDICTED: fatty-acid amide hydrolase 1-like, partial [Odobenus rosmarus divergens]|uniref:Fatty-acid amide hydrolase 1-like n=1 Tax=Odobenus rosmarus divergens TaxID=9708 RepID=A0A9B0GJS0_ODORO
NCLTDFLGECEEELQALKNLKKTERGLLYGVPISLKDTYDCKGHDSMCGLAQFLEKPTAKDGVIVKVLKAQGAIPFVKTNIPQTLLSPFSSVSLGFYCSNPIYGRTLNPLNLKKTPGGSSGGEGVMLAQGGSILGTGSDTAGGIRIPASFCGVLTTVAGPIARDVESLVLCMRALLSEDMHRLDPTVPFMPFREEVYSSNQPLRIGYCESDGFAQPTPSMARAMRLTSRPLQAAGGHQVIPFSIPRIECAVEHLLMGGLFADGGATLLEKLEGDIVDPCIKTVINMLRLPDPLKCFLAYILKYIEYQQEFIAKWRSLDLDVLLTLPLTPAFSTDHSSMALDGQRRKPRGLQFREGPRGGAHPTLFPTCLFRPLTWAGRDLPTVVSSYWSLYNVLNFPAGVVPVNAVTLQDEEELAFYKGYYGDSSDKSFWEAVQGSVGLPVAVQGVALPWEEELCLRFMKEVETLAKNHRGPE